jgi:tripartite-type tricarboxylate transporter receptor subunit TctC
MSLVALLRRRIAAAVAAAALLSAPSQTSAAERYPSHPVKIVVPFAAGGSIDFVARVAAKELSATLGQSFVVENRTGASGKIGVVSVKQAPPDGYTLLLGTGLTHGINPALLEDLGYDPVKDFMPAVHFASNKINFMVRSELPAKNLREMADLIRSKPGQFSFGTGGTGTANHMMGVVYLAQAGLPPGAATAVPYRGEAPAFADLIGGRVQFMIASGNKAHVDNGTLRVLATTGRTRSLLYPDIPTTTELGFDDVYYLGWYGLMAPVGTPLEIVQALNEASARFLARDDVKKILTDGGMEPVGGSIESFTKLIADDAAHWQRVAKQYKLADQK